MSFTGPQLYMNKELLTYFKGDELAANVWKSKYAQEGEITPNDMHKRLAKEFSRIEQKYSKFNEDSLNFKELSEYGKEITIKNALTSQEDKEKELFKLFKNFNRVIPQGSVMSQLGSKSIGSLSNCFVIGQPEDSYGGIFKKDQEQVQLMKRRGGVGIDISTLRPEGTSTTNAAKTSTGAVSFMHRFSNSTREVAQNGRRGALMLSMDVNHPDILEFIKIKRDLTQVTGANISIKLNKEFMKAVENDDDYILRFPCDISTPDYVIEYNILQEVNSKENGLIYIKRVKAKELWDEVIKSAHSVAEPGLMYWDNMVNYSPDGVYPQFKQITTNPCSEIGMQPYDACRLMVVNLYNYVSKPFTKDAVFKWESFYKDNYHALMLNDDLVDLEVEHIDRIIKKIKNDPESLEVKSDELILWMKVKETAIASRRTGLGFTALGDTLAALGLKYDSDEGLKMIEIIMRMKLESELDSTIDMAITRGTFKGWDRKLEHPSIGILGNDFYSFLYSNFPNQFEKMQKFGRRNVSWSCIAPTGSVSLLSQTTSGIEPLFQPFHIRRKKINNKDTKVDFVDVNGDAWQEFFILHPKFREWLHFSGKGNPLKDINNMSQEELEGLFKRSPWYKSTANDINWKKRVDIQAICQKYITHSISSTVNLPKDIATKVVDDIYMRSWKKGLKGITVYRDGSRDGVLVTKSEKDTKEEFQYKDAVKRPKTLKAEGHVTVVNKSKFNVIVGLVDYKPYEIFMIPYQRDLSKGELSKESKGVYNYTEDKSKLVIEGVTSKMSDEQAAITRLVSTSLRHGADIKFIVEQLNKADGDLFSFTKGLARVLKKYIPEGTKSTVSCQDCGSSNVVFEEGCNKCLDCGSSKCG